MLYYLFVDDLSRLHQFVGDLVSMNQVSTTSHEHLAHYRFAARNATGQADLQQGFLVCPGLSMADMKGYFTTETQRHGEKQIWGI